MEPGRRRCYHCRKPICPECQHRAEGHIFCSDHCAGAERRRARWRRFQEWNRTALAGRWFRAALFSALLIVGAGVIWLSMHADLLGGGPEAPAVTFKKPREKGIDYEKLNWDSPGACVIDQPSSGAVLRDNRVVVKGKAPSEAMVGLYVNGEKVDVQMCRGGEWRFDGVPLTGSRNLVQARFFDNMGNSSYSPAVLVELQAAPVKLVLPPPEVPPQPSVDLANLTRGPVGRREVFLTFDGGSTANVTAAILDILKKENVRATVFLTGEYMQRYPELTRRIVEDGHLVGNHTYSHPHLTTYSFNARQNTLAGVGEEFVRSQLQRTAERFQLITGRRMSSYWRPPSGSSTARSSGGHGRRATGTSAGRPTWIHSTGWPRPRTRSSRRHSRSSTASCGAIRWARAAWTGGSSSCTSGRRGSRGWRRTGSCSPSSRTSGGRATSSGPWTTR